MVSIAFKLQALPEKRQELMQTLEAIMENTLVIKGCVNCTLKQDPKNLNAVTFLTKWRSQEAFQDYQKLEQFLVLLGAFNLLCSSKKMEYDDVKNDPSDLQ
jgi:quinol monooxygenase YgiN